MLKAILYFLAGLGILLFGVSVMSGGLEKVTGSKVRKYINRFAKNRFQGFGLGFLTTILLQSSTAASIMFVGFTASGIITLFQGICMLIGSNVGTTITTIILSFKTINAIEILSVLVLVGVIINIISKNQKTKQIGNIIIGLGLLFAGMVLIDEATIIFKTFEGFNAFISSITNPLVLIFLGIILTMLTQSSLGTIAILISLAGAGAGAYSIISLQSASFIVYGANIGTCLTALLVGFTNNAQGKRVALFHVLFNVFGTIVFALIGLTPWLDLLAGIEPSLAIILINIIFNTVTAIITLPFAKLITKWMEKLFVKNKTQSQLFVLDKSSYELPTIAIKNINQGMLTAFDLMRQYVYDFKEYIKKINLLDYNKLNKGLTSLNVFVDSVKESALQISGKLSETDEKNLSTMFEVAQNYKRVVHNLDEILQSTVNNQKPIKFTQSQIDIMYDLGSEVINIINADKNIYYHIFNENYNIDFEVIVDGIMVCTNYISDVKNKQKKLLIDKKKTEKIEKYANFLNITNQFDEIGNDFNDISVNLAEIFVKLEEETQ